MTESFQSNPAFAPRDTVALYIEGVKCRFVSVQMMTEEGGIPYIAITVPATPELRHVGPRARVHLIAVEPAPPHNVIVMGEFEITERGFEKGDDTRNLTFTAVHVTSHLDQYEITTLDTTTSIQALGGAGNLGGTQVNAAFTGNILELLNVEQLTADLREFSATARVDTALAATSAVKTPNRTPNATQLTVRDVVLGAFLLYRKIFRNSRLSDTYTSVAVDMHQLIARFQFPDPDLIDWSEVYSKLMAQLLVQGPQQAGGSQTFLDVIRGICQFFLHGVHVIPNAESVTKQVQIKPLTHFNAVPRCNVFFPSMTGGLAFRENFASQPTRLQTMFAPLGTAGEFDLTLFQRELTMFAPSELQYLWRKILDATATGAPAPPKNEQKRPLTFFKPADGVPFLTHEEDRRGIVTMQYTVPPLLNTVVLSQTLRTSKTDGAPGLPELPKHSDPTERKYALSQQLFSAQPEDRRAKYMAFLCVALGDGGLDAKTYETAAALRGSIRVFSSASSNFLAVPTRITLVPVRYSFQRNETLSRAAVQGINTNYLVLRDGKVVQLLSRSYHRFAESSAVPLGVKLAGSSPTLDATLNNSTPVYGKSYTGWRSQTVRADAVNVEIVKLAGADQRYALVFRFETRDGRLEPTGGWSFSPERPLRAAQLNDFRSGRVRALIPFGKAAQQEVRAEVLTVGTAEDDQGAVVYRVIIDAPGAAQAPGAALPSRAPVTLEKVPDSSTVKPWFFCQAGSGAWKATSVRNAFRLLADAKSAVVSKFGLSVVEDTGNERNLTIAIDLGRDGRVTDSQKTALARLIAAVQELQVTSVGTLDKPAKQSGTLPVKPLNEYFNVSMAALNGQHNLPAMQDLQSLISTFRTKLFEEFNAWDKGLTGSGSGAQFIPLTTAPADVAATAEKIPQTEGRQGAASESRTTAPSAAARQFSAQYPEAAANGAAATPTPTQATGTGTKRAAPAEAPQAAIQDLVQAPANAAELNIPEFNEITFGFLRGFLNYQFYSARVAPHTLNVSLPFHPYVTPGYPALVLDTTRTGYDLVGYVHAVAHDFTPTGMQTTVTLTHVRRTITEDAEDIEAFEAIAQNEQTQTDRAKGTVPKASFNMLQREAMIPFSKTLTNQFVMLAPINNGTIMSKLGLEPLKGPDNEPLSNLTIARDPELYYTYLQRLAQTADKPCVIPSTFLPIQLHDLETKLPPIFVYDGGFGLGRVDQKAAQKARTGLTANVRNFNTYAVYLGYNQAANNQKPLLNVESNFIFADTIRNVSRTLSVQQAYAYNRRGVQRLGQNNLAAANASLVDYALKEDIENTAAEEEAAADATTVQKTTQTAAKLPTGVKGIPEQIVVYKQPPIFANGVRKDPGAVLVFDNNIRGLVLRHNLHVRQFEALPHND
jgi:hypothetical protein